MGGAYEKVTRGATVEHVHYIRGGGDVVAIQKKTVGGSTETRYLHRDHLGSVVAATDYQGTVLERYSFDPWGKRRDPASWVTPAPGTFSYDPAFNDRGFTGHEHIDHLGLVNMNGRVYDPEIGRFLSADPFVQFPQSTQGYNRYTYVGNNPLSYTDPSGFFSFKSFMKIVGIAMSMWMPGFDQVWQRMLWAFVSGYLASGGDFKAGLLNALSAPLILPGDSIGVMARNAAIQGGVAAAQGGKFRQAFLSSLANSYLSYRLAGTGGSTSTDQPGAAIARVMRAAIVGGVSAEIGGGKFRNDAMTAAFLQIVAGRNEIESTSETSAEATDETTPLSPERLEETAKTVFDVHEQSGINDCADYVIDVANAYGNTSLGRIDKSTNANSMIEWLNKNATIVTVDKAIELASSGHIVLGAAAVPGGNGHVSLVLPGEGRISGKWGGIAPLAANRSMDAVTRPQLNFFGRTMNYAFTRQPTFYLVRQ